MTGIVLTLLTLISFSSCLEVLFPAGGNIWDLDQVNTYKVFWKSVAADPSHVHIALHDRDGNTIDSYERVKTDSGSCVISGLSGLKTGSGYRIVVFDSSTPKHKIVARSGKFSIRQQADSLSSGIAAEPYPTVIQASATTVAPATTSANSPVFTTATSTPSSPQITSDISPTTKSVKSVASSVSTRTSSQSSTAFPKYVVPGQGGLSNGSKIGIGVGVALLMLTCIGVGFFFWRRRQREGQDVAHDGSAAEFGHHGKPELVGDDAPGIEHNLASGDGVKPELETHSSPAEVSDSHELVNDTQPTPMGVADLPNRTSTNAIPDGVAELPHQSPGDGFVPDRTAAEIDSNPVPHKNQGIDPNQMWSLDDIVIESNQNQNQNHQKAAVELPARKRTAVAPQNVRSSLSTEQPHSPQEKPPALSTTQSVAPSDHLSSPSSTTPTAEPRKPPAASIVEPATSRPIPSQCAPTTEPSQPLAALNQETTPPPATLNVEPIPSLAAPTVEHTPPHNDESIDGDLEALRRRERSIAESIFAAEELGKLRREHLEIQERIRMAEERARMVHAKAAKG